MVGQIKDGIGKLNSLVWCWYGKPCIKRLLIRSRISVDTLQFVNSIYEAVIRNTYRFCHSLKLRSSLRNRFCRNPYFSRKGPTTSLPLKLFYLKLVWPFIKFCSGSDNKKQNLATSDRSKLSLSLSEFILSFRSLSLNWNSLLVIKPFVYSTYRLSIVFVGPHYFWNSLGYDKSRMGFDSHRLLFYVGKGSYASKDFSLEVE